jgi:hypothetical protein
LQWLLKIKHNKVVPFRLQDINKNKLVSKAEMKTILESMQSKNHMFNLQLHFPLKRDWNFTTPFGYLVLQHFLFYSLRSLPCLYSSIRKKFIAHEHDKRSVCRLRCEMHSMKQFVFLKNSYTAAHSHQTTAVE